MKCGSDHTNRGFDAMFTGLDSSHVCKRDDEANRSVAAHTEVAHVVEEDEAALTGFILGFHQQRADNDVRPARLVDDSRAEWVKITLKNFATIVERSGAEIRSAGDDDTRRLAAGV